MRTEPYTKSEGLDCDQRLMDGGFSSLKGGRKL